MRWRCLVDTGPESSHRTPRSALTATGGSSTAARLQERPVHLHPGAADAGHLLSCPVTVTYTLFPTTVSAASAAVHVNGAAEQLDDLAVAVDGVGPGKSLSGKVSAIQNDLAEDDTAGACATLGAFISEVRAQTGKKISTPVAASQQYATK